MLFQTPCKQPSSWTQEPKTSEMHHPAASITGPCSVIHDAANIPQPIRIPFSCNGGEHSWNYRVGPSPEALIVHYLSLVLNNKRIFFPFNLEIWKQHFPQFKYLNGFNFIYRHNRNSNVLKRSHAWSTRLWAFFFFLPGERARQLLTRMALGTVGS